MAEIPCPPEQKSISNDHSWVSIARINYAELPMLIVGTENFGLFVCHIGFGLTHGIVKRKGTHSFPDPEGEKTSPPLFLFELPIPEWN